MRLAMGVVNIGRGGGLTGRVEQAWSVSAPGPAEIFPRFAGRLAEFAD